MIGQCLVSELVELSSLCIALNRFVKQPALKLLKPNSQFRDFLGSKLFDGFLNVFDFTHFLKIARKAAVVKNGERSVPHASPHFFKRADAFVLRNAKLTIKPFSKPSLNQLIVFRVLADPKPAETVFDFCRQRAMIATDTRGP